MYSLPVEPLGGSFVRRVELTASRPGSFSAYATIGLRPHPFPPPIVYDWLGGYLDSGAFWQVGILQACTGPDTSNPLQAFAWATFSRGDQGRPDDPLPQLYVPLPGDVLDAGWARVGFDGRTFYLGSMVLGRLDAVSELGPVSICHETRTEDPRTFTGWKGAFRNVRVDRVIPHLDGVSALPMGAAYSSTRGNVVLVDVGPSSTPCHALGW